jgi:outer membrane protein OmpA-like peptidoglycan-associated protein
MIGRILLLLLTISSGTASAQHHAGGLKGDYYNGIDFDQFVLSRVDKKIGFSSRLKSPCRGVGKEFFSIRWSGTIVAPTSGMYRFHILADDGVRLWVNHQLVIDGWIEQEATAYTGKIMLEKDEGYDIRIEYFNTVIHSVIDVQWELPPEVFATFGNSFHLNVGKTPIPYQQLKPLPSAPKAKASLVMNERTQRLVQHKKPEAKPFIPESTAKTVNQTKVRKPKTEFEREEPIVLKTVIFEQQKAEIPNAAYPELNTVVTYLKKHSHKKIKISGHTDYIGDSLDNQILSEARARAVADYLVKSGIDPVRVTSEGFGSRTPLVVNDKLEDRLVNRRVEFVIRD